jgi:hypothetical protein
VYTNGGEESDAKLPYDVVGIQIVVRGEPSTSWAIDTWRAIYNELHGKRNATLPDGSYVVFIMGTGASPYPLGPDDNGRPQYSADYRAEFLNPTKERQ